MALDLSQLKFVPKQTRFLVTGYLREFDSTVSYSSIVRGTCILYIFKAEFWRTTSPYITVRDEDTVAVVLSNKGLRSRDAQQLLRITGAMDLRKQSFMPHRIYEWTLRVRYIGGKSNRILIGVGDGSRLNIALGAESCMGVQEKDVSVQYSTASGTMRLVVHEQPMPRTLAKKNFVQYAALPFLIIQMDRKVGNYVELMQFSMSQQEEK